MHRGELAKAIIRLRFACEELTLSTDEPDVETMLARLTYHVENYWVRAYELQERAVVLVAALYGGSQKARSQLARDLHQKGKRQPAFDKIRERIPKLVKPLDQLLKALNHDIEIRTVHTHHRFLLIGVWANGHFIPNDALLDLEDDPKERKQLEKFLRKEARKLAGQQQRKADSVIKVAQALWGQPIPTFSEL